MAKYPAEEPTLQVFKNRFDKAGPRQQRLSPEANAFLDGQQQTRESSLGNTPTLVGSWDEPVASPDVAKSSCLTRMPQGLFWAWCVTSSGWFVCHAGALCDGCLVSPTVLLDTLWECWLLC